MKHKLIFMLIIIVPLLFCAAGYTAVKEIVSEGTYNMGDGETPSVAESRALLNAKKSALEEAGTYVQSYSKVKNYKLTSDEIRIISSGIMSVTILEKKRSVVGDGINFFVKIKAQITLDQIEAMSKTLREEKKMADNYNTILSAYEKSQREIEILKKQLSQASNPKEKEQAENKIRQDEKEFIANQFMEKGYAALYSLDASYASRFNDAVEYFTSAISNNPKLATAYIERGRAYTIGKIDHDKAIEDFNKALKIKPDLITSVYYNRGIAYAYKGQYDKAIDDFNRCIEINPNAWGALSQRASAYEKSGQIDKAIQEYTRLIKNNPENNMSNYSNRAHAYKKVNKFNLALKDYNKLIEMYPNNTSDLFSRGALYYEMGLYDKAIKDFSRCIKINPTAYYYIARGEVYAKAGKNTLAKADYKNACDMGTELGCQYYNTLKSGSNWVVYGNNVFGDNYYYDKMKIKYYPKNLVSVWYKQVYSTDGRKSYINTLTNQGLSQSDLYRKGYDQLAYTLMLWEMNCKNRTHTIKSIVYYAESGLVIEQFNYENLIPHNPIAPGSVIELLFDTVCRKGKI